MFLVIYLYNLNEIKDKSQVNFFYCDINYKNLIDFEVFGQKVMERFNINGTDMFVFLKDGQQIYNFQEIQRDQHTLVISNQPVFKGVYNLCFDKVKLQKIIKILNELESPIQQFMYSDQFSSTMNLSNMNSLAQTQSQNGFSQTQRQFNQSQSNQIYKKDIQSFNSEFYQSQEQKVQQNYSDVIGTIIKMLEERELEQENKLQFDSLDDYMKSNNDKSLLENQYLKKINGINNYYTEYVKYNEKEEGTDDSQELKEIQTDIFKQVEQELTNLLQKNKIANITESSHDKPIFMSSNKLPYSVDSRKVKSPLFQNKHNLQDHRTVCQKVQQSNPEMFSKNIPKYMLQYQFSRKQIHSIYILYKVLQLVTSQRYKSGFYDMKKGLDFKTFKNGIDQVMFQSEEIVKRQFETVDINHCGFVNWEDFLQLMVKLRAKTLENKIDLFLKAADINRDGKLNRKEIFNLCKMCIEKYYVYLNDKLDDEYLDNVANYYTKLIYQSVVSSNQEIELDTIRQTILSNQLSTQDNQFLIMFCGADA